MDESVAISQIMKCRELERSQMSVFQLKIPFGPPPCLSDVKRADVFKTVSR